MEWIKKFFREEEGTETVEWAVVAGLLIAASVLIWQTMGNEVERIITLINTALATIT